MNVFQQILDCRSLTIIGYLAEDMLTQATSDAERAAFQAIYETNKLDEAYAIAHEQLGNQEAADTLRLFMQTRQSQNRADSLEDILAY